MQGMNVRRGSTFDVYFCGDMDLFLDALHKALDSIQGMRKEAMLQEVQDSYDQNGICGYVDTTRRIYYVCINHDKATLESFDDMSKKVLAAYPPLLTNAKPVPRFMSDREITQLQQPQKRFLDSVGAEIFNTTGEHQHG